MVWNICTKFVWDMQNFILNKAKYVRKLLQAKSNMAADRYLELKKNRYIFTHS